MVNYLMLIESLSRVWIEELVLSVVRQCPVKVPVVIVASSAPTTFFTVTVDRMKIEVRLPSEFKVVALTDHY